MRPQQLLAFEVGRVETFLRTPVRQNYADDHQRGDDERGHDAAQVEAAFLVRLGERVAERRAQWPRQNVRGPEQKAVGDFREVVERRDDRDQPGEDERAALEAESGVVRREVAERRAERV